MSLTLLGRSQQANLYEQASTSGTGKPCKQKLLPQEQQDLSPQVLCGVCGSEFVPIQKKRASERRRCWMRRPGSHLSSSQRGLVESSSEQSYGAHPHQNSTKPCPYRACFMPRATVTLEQKQTFYKLLPQSNTE